MSLSSASKPANTAENDDISLFSLLGIGLLVVMGGLALAYFIDASVEPPKAPELSRFEKPFAAQNIGGVDLVIPHSWFRESLRNTGNFSDQASLSLWVKFHQIAPTTNVDLTFLPKSATQASAMLLDSVYLRQFQNEQLSGPAGLIGKPLAQKDGFANETVWYDPLSSRPFVAKCMAPLAQGQKSRCLRTIYAKGSLSVTYEFDFDALNSWRNFDAVMSPYLAAIGAL